MIPVIAALALGASALPARAQELEPERAVFVEWSLSRDEGWQGETLRAGVRFGLEEGFLAERLVQPFRRNLDVPVRLLLPGLADGKCLVVVPVAATAGAEFALDEDVARARELGSEERDGARFRIFEHELELRPTCVGELALPAPQLVVTTAASFRVDVFGNRTPVEPREVVRAGATAALRVRALPEAGRPGDFSGGVGTFTLRAALRDPHVRLGQGLMLDLVVEGRGDLAALEPPRLDGLPGLRVRGRLEHFEPGRVTWSYELAALDLSPVAVPAIELVVFDPQAGDWRTLSSEALPIAVLPPAPEAEPGPTTTPSRSEAPEPMRRAAWWIAIPAVVLLAWWWQARRRAIEAPSPSPSPAAGRARAARDALAGAQGDAMERYTRFLATFLDCAPPAVVGARLAERLEQAGAPRELAQRMARHHDELIAVLYGGRVAGPDGEAEALADELAASLSRPD